MLNLKTKFANLFLVAAFLIVPCMASAYSFPAPFTNWSISLDGVNSMIVPNYLTISGLGYIENTPTGPDSFSFTEHAVFQALANNFGSTIQDEFGPYQLTGSLYGYGNVGGGVFDFSGGTLDLYVSTPRTYGKTSNDFYGSESGIKIASFDIISGGGFTNPNTTPAGSVSTQLVSSFLNPGYFFDPYGNDIALQSYPIEWLFALSNVTASYNSVQATNPLFTQALFNSFGIIASDSVPFSFYVSNSGEFTIGVVPEPSTMLLLGAGLLGLGVVSRRRKKN